MTSKQLFNLMAALVMICGFATIELSLYAYGQHKQIQSLQQQLNATWPAIKIVASTHNQSVCTIDAIEYEKKK